MLLCSRGKKVSARDPARAAQIDEVVSRARAAAEAFRRMSQPEVDRIVQAMVVAGLESAVELAGIATEETGFGVFEDKVVKNYVATEFLWDYLKDKKTVGVIAEEPERNLQYVAEPVGVVMAILPVTNPTSTVLFKAIVAAKTRNAILFRPSPRAIRCALATVEILRKAGEQAGLPPDALQVIPDATPTRPTSTLRSGRRAGRRSCSSRTRPGSRASVSGRATRRCICTAAATCAARSSTS